MPTSPRTLVLLLLAALALPMSACGGGGGGSTGEAGRGLVLLGFSADSVATVPLNDVLEFRFSEPVDTASITPASIQIREGPEYGRNVAGSFVIQGSSVFFHPRLPSTCDLADSGIKPGSVDAPEGVEEDTFPRTYPSS